MVDLDKQKENYLYTSWTPYNGVYVENNSYDKDYSYGYCVQYCYNYHGEQFALTSKSTDVISASNSSLFWLFRKKKEVFGGDIANENIARLL